MRQAKKISLVSSVSKTSESHLDSETKKMKVYWMKTCKPNKMAFKVYASSYNVEILNSFNPELQLKDTKSAIRNKLIDLLFELKSFKFVIASTSFKLWKSQKVIKKQNMIPFNCTQKQKQLLVKVTLMFLDLSVVLLYQTYPKVQEKVWAELPIQSQIII